MGNDSYSNGSFYSTGAGSASSLFYIMISLEILLMITITPGNTFVLIVIYKFKSLQTPTNVFIAFLAMADLCVAFSLSFHVVCLIRPSITDHFKACMFRYWILIFPASSSALLLLGISPFNSSKLIFFLIVRIANILHFFSNCHRQRTGLNKFLPSMFLRRSLY